LRALRAPVVVDFVVIIEKLHPGALESG